MKAFIVLLGLCLIGFCAGVEAGPFGGQPKEVIKKVVPEVYDISIYLKGGEVVKVQKVGATPWGVKHRLSFNSLDNTLRVITPDKDGTNSIRVIKTADIEKIEAVPIRKPDIEVKPAPVPENVPAPKPVAKGRDFAKGCKCADCKCDNCDCCKCND